MKHQNPAPLTFANAPRETINGNVYCTDEAAAELFGQLITEYRPPRRPRPPMTQKLKASQIEELTSRLGRHLRDPHGLEAALGRPLVDNR